MVVRRICACRGCVSTWIIICVTACITLLTVRNVRKLFVLDQTVAQKTDTTSNILDGGNTTVRSYTEEVTDLYNYHETTNEDTDVPVTHLDPGVDTHETTSDKPLILVWNAQNTPLSPIPADDACGGGCRVSNDRSKVKESNALVFSMKGLVEDDVPDQNSRDGNQVYVWWSEDSPWMSKHMYNLSMKHYQTYDRDFFNWTMTYKPSSDVNAMMIPYTAIDFVMKQISRNRKRVDGLHPTFVNNDAAGPSKSQSDIKHLQMHAKKLVRKKSKGAIWISSNCGYTAAAVLRRKIVTELQFQGLQVDIFGRCGDMNIPDDLSGFLHVISQYKFSLAFENALHCNSYISEKFWYNGLYAGTIPIVWGPTKSDLEAIAPDKSFIHYEDFKSSQSLIQHLHDISNNKTKYLEYLSWWWESPGTFPVYGVTEFHKDLKNRRASYDFEMNAFCGLCYMLSRNVHLKRKKTIRSLREWWYDGETSTCLDKFHDVKIDRLGSTLTGAYEVYKFGGP